MTVQYCIHHFAECNFQLRVTAYDDQDPGRLATAEVTILVQRNANAPKFKQTSYRTTLDEKSPLGVGIINVTASDGDGVSIASF